MFEGKGELLSGLTRVRSFADALWRFYGRPEFLAYVQVMLNLSHDPTTEAPTREALAKMQARLEEHLPGLLDRVLGDHPAARNDGARHLGRLVFTLLRALAIAQQIAVASSPDAAASPFMAGEREMLIEAIVNHADAAARPRRGRR